MNKEVELKVLKEKSKIENKLMQKQQMEAENIPPSDCDTNRNNPLHCYNTGGLQQCNRKLLENENLPPLPSGFTLPETAVKSDDVVSCCVATPADTSASNAKLKREGQGFIQKTCQLADTVSPQIETNFPETEESFQEDVEKLLQACQNEYSPSQTADFYKDKIKSLKENHIPELLKEKDKLDIEFHQVQKKLKENRHVITKKLNTIENILCSSAVLNKFLELQIDETIEKEKREIQGIKNNLMDSVSCTVNSGPINSTILNDPILTEVGHLNIKIKENEAKKEGGILGLQVSEKKNVLEESEAAEKEVNHKEDIQQNSQSDKKKIENLNKVNIEIDKISRELKQSQDELKIVKIELENKINTIRQHAHHEQERNLEINHLKSEAKMFKMQFRQSQNELKDAKKELHKKVLTIQQKEECELEEIKLNKKNELSQKLVSKLQNELEQTQNEMEAVKKELNEKVDIIEQMTQHDMKTLQDFIEINEEVIMLRSQLAGAENELTVVKRELSYDIFTIQQNNQLDQKAMEEHHKAKVNELQNQLTVTQEELKKVRKELSSKSDKQQKVQEEQKVMEELNKAKTIILQNKLTVAQEELKSVRKELTCIAVMKQKAQDKQKVKKEINEEEKEVNVLQNQLAATQRKLEAVTKELNNTLNGVEKNLQREQKISEVGFREIRMMLVKKLGFTDKNNPHFESYMKEERCRGIVSDIRRLIKDKVQLCDEPISETGTGSTILKVTENEVHLVVAIACFLKVVPFSASTDFIYSFVAQIDNVISRQHVESLLKKFPTLFNEESAGSTNKNWKYMDLTPIINI